MEKPIRSVWTAAERVSCYFAGTIFSNIVYRTVQNGPVSLVGFNDSDLTGYKMDRKSPFGYVLFLVGEPYSGVQRRVCSHDVHGGNRIVGNGL